MRLPLLCAILICYHKYLAQSYKMSTMLQASKWLVHCLADILKILRKTRVKKFDGIVVNSKYL